MVMYGERPVVLGSRALAGRLVEAVLGFRMSLHNPSDWKLFGLVCPVLPILLL